MSLESVSVDRVRLPKTAEVVAQTLRSQIVRGEVPEGAPLPSEAALMERFGISRPSLREAFRILESERLIEVRRGSRGGARASRPDIAVAARHLGVIMQFDQVTLNDVFVARAYFEPLGFRLLAAVPDREKAVAELRELLETLAEPNTSLPTAYVDFFVALFARAGNRPLELLYCALTEVVGRELEDAVAITAPSDEARVNVVRRSLGKALSLVEKGEGAAAAEFWTKQMLMGLESVSEHHAGKTLVEATDAY